MTVEAKNGQMFEIVTTHAAKSERTARLQAIMDALGIGQKVLSIELNKRWVGK